MIISNAIERIVLGEQYFSNEISEALAAKDNLAKLTLRETEILRQVARGKSNKTIALEMSISEWAVKYHVKSILSKLEVNSRTDTVFKAVESGIISC